MTQPHYIDRELLPCPNPWCDSGVQPMSFAMRGGFHQVICGCDFKGPRKATKEESEAAWNLRPGVNIALPKPAVAQPDGYTTADDLKAVIRQWLDATRHHGDLSSVLWMGWSAATRPSATEKE